MLLKVSKEELQSLPLEDISKKYYKRGAAYVRMLLYSFYAQQELTGANEVYLDVCMDPYETSGGADKHPMEWKNAFGNI